MDAKISQIQIKPARFNKDGELTTEEYASITMNIPLDSAGQKESLIELIQLTSREWVIAEITALQTKLPLKEG